MSIQQIEQLPLGVESESVVKMMGPPDEKREVGGETIWIYDTSDRTMQRASFSLDQKRKLVSKTFIPIESEPESKVDFVVKNKYYQYEFGVVDFPQCGMDYVSSRALYADVGSGLSVLYNKESNETEAIGWMSPAQLRQDIEDIKSCRNNARAKK